MKLLSVSSPQQVLKILTTLLALGLFGVGANANAAPNSVSKWEVLEETFRSSKTYANPPQEVRLTVEFISPGGRTNRVHGFWEGGSKWGVRFRPDEIGRWTYVTRCSEPRDRGLNGQTGGFLCTVQSLRLDQHKHGPIAVRPGSATFQHADGTPFFWLSDGVWAGARKSSNKEWAEYVHVRSAQEFNVALWSAAPGVDARGRQAFDGGKVIEINPRFLGDLDERIVELNQSDMISAIAPLWELGLAGQDLLPEDQVIVLLRQMVARWDAYHVVWVIAFEADTDGRNAARWRRIGRNVFDGMNHSPVILFCGSSQWALKDFAREAWISAIAFKSGNDVSQGASLWLAKGPAATLWQQQPVRPVLNLLPATEAGFTAEGQAIHTSQAVQSLARSLFVAPPAGLCYQNRAVADWDQTPDPQTQAATGVELLEWQKSLHLPGTKRAGQIRELLVQDRFDRLTPADTILLPPPKDNASANSMCALSTSSRTRALIYVPSGQTVRLRPEALRGEYAGQFFNLQSGELVPATAITSGRAVEFIAPTEPGDWLLFLGPEER